MTADAGGGPEPTADGKSGAAEPTANAEAGADAHAGTEHTVDGDAILRIRDLDAGYGDLQILSDVVLDVDDEEYVTIVGPNGAGKSTVMKTVFGLTAHMGGTVEFEGTSI
ncbi:ATP-binding cassette domain-containing protein, partial [Halorubrum sp. AD140]|uniref:ATP-binding cassette domain-containing protein n=1 Tax=Halorubrum sp. AD140 TaxID=3050073 RepID=UPI002ACC46E3